MMSFRLFGFPLACLLALAACSTVHPNQQEDPVGRAVNNAALSDSGQRGNLPKPPSESRVAKAAPDSDCIPNPDGSDSCAPTSAPIKMPAKKK